jgi:hypothetical protein
VKIKLDLSCDRDRGSGSTSIKFLSMNSKRRGFPAWPMTPFVAQFLECVRITRSVPK